MMEKQILNMSSVSQLEKKEILVSHHIRPGVFFLSHWRNTNVKQVCKSQAFRFTAFIFWRLPYTMETHTQFHTYLHHFSIQAIYLI